MSSQSLQNLGDVPSRPAIDGAAMPPRVELGSYVLLRTLSPHRGYLAAGPGGREVVLKMLQADCLIKGQLHPSIRERLARVRELPERTVANLHGVEKDQGHAYLVWDYVPGELVTDYARDSQRSPRDLARLARELVLAVESLHAAGIVHGAIRASNVIVTPLHEVRLTHVSPLLYSDPEHDVAATLDLLDAMQAAAHEPDEALGRILHEARADAVDLRTLATRLAALREPERDLAGGAAGASGHVSPREPHFRRRALIAAGAVTVAGVAVAAGVWRYQSARSDDPYAARESPRATAAPAATNPPPPAK